MPERLQPPKTWSRAMRKGVCGQVRRGAPSVAVPANDETKHALLAERIRIKHIRKALACAADGLFRERCEAELASSMARELDLERTLRAAVEATGHGQGHLDALQLGGCLLSAMDMARANGDASAAEVVAQECLVLVEMHCRTLLGTQRFESTGRPCGQARFSAGAAEP